MLDHYRTPLARIPFAVASLISLIVLFTPETGVPTAPPGTDKVVHFALFATLALTGRWARVPAAPLVAGLICYAAGSEVLQGVLPIGRSGDVVDALVDAAGVIAGWALSLIRLRRTRAATSPQRRRSDTPM